MQTKKEEKKYRPPSEVQEDSEEDDDEEEEKQTQKKKTKKKTKKKKTVEEEEDDDDEEQEQAHDELDNYNMKKSLHPIATLFTFLFKGGAAAMYLLGSTVFSDKIVFITVVLLASFDFWTVKNISGRLLVGLRWWSDYDEEGNEVWRFESPERNFEANIVDKSFFWTSQFSITIFWSVFLVLNTISLDFYWGILDVIGFLLSSVNLWGFYKCSKEHQDKLKDMRNNLLKKGLLNVISKR